ncbi:MAG: hypothetical protein MMC23_005051 [Stictis urceolatum]|nr:hypothetical protein [Stictis urceolata]
MIGAVGDEPYGQQLLEELARNGIDTEGVEVIPDEISGVAVIIVEESTGENRILVTPGANAKLTAKAFEAFLVRGKPDLVVLQLETPLDTVISVIETSKKLGVEVLLNPAPAVPLPESILHGLDHLVMNETEAGILAGWCGESVDEDSLGKVHQKFETLGVRNTVVTLGANGVSYNLDNGQAASVPAEKVSKVVDTTAAGDTFVGAYAVEIARSKASGSSFDKDLAVKKANRAAARTVEKAGAMKSIPWLDELEISTS